jgi:protein TonB
MRLPGPFLASCAVHAVVLFGTTSAVMQPVRYEVEAGSGGMEVSLIAAPLPAPAAAAIPAIPDVPQEAPAPEAAAEDWRLEPVPLPEPQAPAVQAAQPVEESDVTVSSLPGPHVGDGSSPVPGTDPTTLYLPGGAAAGTNARLKNPAPPYPYPAIRQHQEGLVLLEAVIDKTGRPLSVDIIQSSGFPLLDQSALRTVRRWKFDPAHIGFLPVQSRVVIPVRFVLDGPRLTELR